MDSRLTPGVEAMIASRRREAEASRRALAAKRALQEQRRTAIAADVTIRQATIDDARELARLAALDSQRPPELPTLVAEVRGELVAALPLRGGGPVADPFKPTADVVRMLELRAAQLSGREHRARWPRLSRRKPLTAFG